MNEYININTLFYAVLVLAALILIMIITFYVSVKPNLKSSSAAVYQNGVDHTIAQIVKSEEEELVTDSELVAVITAAIYASLGDEVPSDGLVVRSIRKSNVTRWRNA